MTEETVVQLIADLHKDEWGRLLAALIADVHEIELAEDGLQDAFASALTSWISNGVPDSPAGWLYRASRNRCIDRLRRKALHDRKRADLEARANTIESRTTEGDDAGDSIEDKRLLLMFTCCHPALNERAQVALTLQTLGGLTAREIARAFLTSEATMAQRLVRAKQKIKKAEIPYRVPAPEQLPERTHALLAIVYLIFNEGYAAGTGTTPIRAALVGEALSLGQTLAALLPRDPEIAGLYALMLLHHSRSPARFKHQRPVPLDQQDRSFWDREAIEKATSILEGALRLGRPGPYQIQAAISAVHAETASADATDWAQITLLYRRLFEMTGSAIVRLNGAVALSFAIGPEAGLQVLAELEQDGGLEHYQPFFAARADMQRRAGHPGFARADYLRAIELTENVADRLFLNDRLVDLSHDFDSE